MHIKKSSYEKEFKTTISQNFKKVADLVDLFKAENYADDIKFNYSLAAEEHYYRITYAYEGNRFNRSAKIIDSTHFKTQIEYIQDRLTGY